MPTATEDVRLSGETGSGCAATKVKQLTHKRHPSLPNVLRLLALVDHHPVQLPN
jgi:hypothetical protein